MVDRISFRSGFNLKMMFLVILLLIETQFYGFISVNVMPHIQVTSSIRITIQDILTIWLFTSSLNTLIRRKERPLFAKIIVLFFFILMIASIFSGIMGTADLTEGGARMLRWLLKYALYFIIVATVDSRETLETFIKVLYVIAIIGLIFQFIETINGTYFSLDPKWDAFWGPDSDRVIEVAGSTVPYIWNRVVYYLYITFFLSFSFFLWPETVKWKNFLYLCIALLGFMLMLIRSTFIFMGVGAVVMFFLSKHRPNVIKYVIILLVLVVLGLPIINLFSIPINFSETFIGTTFFRLQTLLNFQNQASFIDRAIMMSHQYLAFLQSPIFGIGPGKMAWSIVNTDTGFINTLVLFGLFGLTAVIVLTITIFHKAIRILHQVEQKSKRAYTRVLGMIGVMSGITFLYIFSFDGFILLPLMTILVMGILDRINALYIRS